MPAVRFYPRSPGGGRQAWQSPRSRRRFGSVNGSRRNLADPDYEPTDEDLKQLSAEAFAGVGKTQADALARMHAEIAVA
jgi:hypothetical protein